MKKFLAVAFTAVVLSATQAFGFGVGAEFTAPFTSSGVGEGVAMTFKLDKVPYLFALGASGNAKGVHVGATADYWMAQGPLIEFLSWYAGPGIYVDLNTGSGGGIDAGLRIPVGLNTYLLNKKFELFLELAPAFGLSLNPFQFPTFGLQNALGFRFWF